MYKNVEKTQTHLTNQSTALNWLCYNAV